MTKLQVFDVPADLQRACADQVALALRPSMEGRQVSIALSGGSTPRKMHEMLAEKPGIDWSKVQVFWGDERTVPPDHEDSNYRMARESLLDRVHIPESNIHRMRGEDDPDLAAEAYEETLRSVLNGTGDEIPRIDVVILGMGDDGHTASLFPGTAALKECKRLVVANRVPQLGTTRLTLTYPMLNAARLVLFLVAGEDKADAARPCLVDEEDRPPAGLVQPVDGELRWLLDAASASQL
jgi:6-phosphogluconolactonase